MSKRFSWKAWLSLWASLVSPGVSVPRVPDRKDQPASAAQEQKEFEHEVDLDESYQGEQFYHGLPIFDKDGKRDFLRPGHEYVDGSWEMPGGNFLMIYIDVAAPSKHIKSELGKITFKGAKNAESFKS